MKKSIFFVLTLVMCLPVFAFAQQPTPQLTNSEAAEMQSFDLKILAVINKYSKKMAPEMQRVQDERKAWLLKLAADHPGYVWHDTTGPADPSGLRSTAQPPQAPTKPVDKPAASQ